jgi:hypothetical protein
MKSFLRNSFSSVRVAIWPIFVITIMLFTSCEKDPGRGGLATIRGKVYGYDYNSSGVLHDSGYVSAIHVYISYGNNTWVDDDVRTSATGEYAFRGLQKGSYRLFVVSKCETCNFNQENVTQQAEITNEDQDLILPVFIIKN